MAGRRLVKPRLRRGHYADEVMETQRREDARRETGEFIGRLAADVGLVEALDRSGKRSLAGRPGDPAWDEGSHAEREGFCRRPAKPAAAPAIYERPFRTR